MFITINVVLEVQSSPNSQVVLHLANLPPATFVLMALVSAVQVSNGVQPATLTKSLCVKFLSRDGKSASRLVQLCLYCFIEIYHDITTTSAQFLIVMSRTQIILELLWC